MTLVSINHCFDTYLGLVF